MNRVQCDSSINLNFGNNLITNPSNKISFLCMRALIILLLSILKCKIDSLELYSILHTSSLTEYLCLLVIMSLFSIYRQHWFWQPISLSTSEFCVFRFQCNWIHVLFVSLCLDYFSHYNVLQIYPVVTNDTKNGLLRLNNISLYTHSSLFKI